MWWAPWLPVMFLSLDLSGLGELTCCFGVLQLAAGSEHIINGRTVRINLAGPRPDQMQQQLGLLQSDFLPQLQGVAWPGQQQQQAAQPQQGAAWPVSPGKIASGVSAI